MPKPQKIAAVKELKENFEQSDAALLAEFTGLKVQEMKELRRSLEGTGTKFKVVKNTLSRIAAKEASMEELIPFLEGSTAIAFIKGDPVEAAKGLDEIARKYPALVVKGGILDGRVLGPDQAKALAKVKPREVLLAQLAGMLISPVQKLAGLLQAPVRDLGYVLAAFKEKLQKEAPADVATPADAAPAEAPADVATPTDAAPAEAPADAISQTPAAEESSGLDESPLQASAPAEVAATPATEGETPTSESSLTETPTSESSLTETPTDDSTETQEGDQ
jgi:large subunit ribosomal protein L10